MKRPFPDLRPALLLASLVLALGGVFAPTEARAQYMSCEAFLDFTESQRQTYVTGFVEGISYTQLALTQHVNQQAERQEELEEQGQFALRVIRGVANDIAQALPAGFTVEEVSGRLSELCAPREKAELAFVVIYAEYAAALAEAALYRAQLQNQERTRSEPPPPSPPDE